MKHVTPGRPLYWWLWPNFYVEKDAIDAAKMGVVAFSLKAVATGLFFFNRYYKDNDLYLLLGGMLAFVLYCGLGYGILRMSQAACIAALLLWGMEMIVTLMQQKPLGMAPLLFWYTIQASRAVFWYSKKKIPAEDPTQILSCTHCGTKYRELDYSSYAPAWYCTQCKNPLPRSEPIAP